MWSIGIYKGVSPWEVKPSKDIRNPVLSGEDIDDVPAAFVADPFMIRQQDKWFMFFEVMNKQSGKGEIGLASSDDGLQWSYQKIVLQEKFHLSYPYVFECNGEYYMIPETFDAHAIRLYRALAFPNQWTFVDSLLKGQFADPSIVYFQGVWWLFACKAPEQQKTLSLYYADDITGPWLEHPKSPIVKGNCRAARPAGRMVTLKDSIIRYAQDCYPDYGMQVRAFKISTLTPSLYSEEEYPNSPVLMGTGSGWNVDRMHHIDPHQLSEGEWIACVDGFKGQSFPKREFLEH